MRKPRNFKLVPGIEGYHLTVGDPGQKIFYLRPNGSPATHYWVQGSKRLRSLIKWLQEVDRYQSSEEKK